jgi:hypothetical protein
MRNMEEYWSERNERRARHWAQRNEWRERKREMREKYGEFGRHHHYHPMVSFGLFLILLGLALLVATNDMLNLGSIARYFTWQTAMIFVGFILLVNRRFTGGILMIAAGAWFFIDEVYYILPPFIKTIYWPGVIILIGLSYIISSLLCRKKYIN